ncbi:pentatricopeptide repeat-containing protein At3g12770 [Amborella trichopoda]|nr:pentatricopeptide repeat-containing protein At3g12770 [Amborella trichopoda]|eukprot:XP_020528574.1 pentatricopeptide repeat-containing protein At3g12770 [Amborella trichopoda]
MAAIEMPNIRFHQLLGGMAQRNTFACNSLIRAHFEAKNYRTALSLYHQMLLNGTPFDNFTFPCVLTTCRHSNHLFLGKQVHAQLTKLGFASDNFVCTALIGMYGELDSIEIARHVLDEMPQRNSIAWTILLGFHANGDNPQLGLQTFFEMEASASRLILKIGFQGDLLVGNALLSMYLDCRFMDFAREVFNQIEVKDVVTWTAMINGYVKNGSFNEGLKLFRKMLFSGIRPDPSSISSILPACARVSAHKHGKEIHCYVTKCELAKNLVVDNALVDMYAKSGSIEYATKIFEKNCERDVVSYTVMVEGCSLHGLGELGVSLFHEMREEGIEPDHVAYSAVLRACKAGALVEEGKLFFDCIEQPEIEDYISMVSLLCRANLFDEARAFIEEHGIVHCAQTQSTLLDGCRMHRKKQMGKRMIEQLIELDPYNSNNYVLLSNIYASMGKWGMVSSLREMIMDLGLKPMHAYSWIVVRNKAHVFGVADVSHPRSQRIYWELEALMEKMRQSGHVLENDFSMHDVDEERECIPSGHSEMLAIGFGLISIQSRVPIRVVKNLRVCRNCHSMAEWISKFVDREIVLKDRDQFHHFKDGNCSCGELW